MFRQDPLLDPIRSARDDAALRAGLAEVIDTLKLSWDLPLERLEAAAKDEIACLLEDARVAVGAVDDDAAGAWRVRVLQVLDVGTCAFPLPELDALREQVPPGALAGVLDHFRARYQDLSRRVAAMVCPLRSEELETLDPVADSHLIHHSVAYTFRSERAFYAILEEARPLISPAANLMFFATGEFTARTWKRFVDTELLFDNVYQWGPESRRGREAIARVNTIHGRYNIPNAAFKWVLLNLVFVPMEWNRLLGWRPFTEVERLGWFHEVMKLGGWMNIDELDGDFDTMRAWWWSFGEGAARRPSEIVRASFETLTAQLLEVVPATVRPVFLHALLAGMDEHYRQALGYPEPDPEAVAPIRAVLRAVGHLGEALPRRPWCRCLHAVPGLYPYGPRVDELGVSRRGHRLPAPAWRADDTPPVAFHGPNLGYAEGVRPIQSGEPIADIVLPRIPMAEVALHTSAESAWLVIDGYVLDVTSFLSIHPGGRKLLLRHAGTDASEAFARAGHSEVARVLATNFRIGRCDG